MTESQMIYVQEQFMYLKLRRNNVVIFYFDIGVNLASDRHMDWLLTYYSSLIWQPVTYLEYLNKHFIIGREHFKSGNDKRVWVQSLISHQMFTGNIKVHSLVKLILHTRNTFVD